MDFSAFEFQGQVAKQWRAGGVSLRLDSLGLSTNAATSGQDGQLNVAIFAEVDQLCRSCDPEGVGFDSPGRSPGNLELAKTLRSPNGARPEAQDCRRWPTLPKMAGGLGGFQGSVAALRHRSTFSITQRSIQDNRRAAWRGPLHNPLAFDGPTRSPPLAAAKPFLHRCFEGRSVPPQRSVGLWGGRRGSDTESYFLSSRPESRQLATGFGSLLPGCALSVP
jgi:hypothetical protein